MQCGLTRPRPQAYYDGKSCDCECGAYDPDCETASVRVLGCPREKKYCSKLGKCSAQSITSTTLAQISDPCSNIWLEGQTTLVGYTGTEEHFNRNFETLTDADKLCMAVGLWWEREGACRPCKSPVRRGRDSNAE